jgi:type VI secretion system protein ImpA
MTRVERIEALLTDQVGASQAPDLSALGRVLKEIRQVLTEQMQRLGIHLVEATPDVEAVEALGLEAPNGAPAAQRLVVGEITCREDALRMLDKICDYFQRYEPSSPVPFLLRRARNLATKDFMEILQDLAPSGTSQADLIFGSSHQNA